MIEALLALVIMLLAVGGMSLGLLRGRKISGSCGGLNNIPGVESDCGGTCRRPCDKRRQAQQRQQAIDTEDFPS